MQNLRTLVDEIDEIVRWPGARAVELIDSVDPYNPVAAVVLREMIMPDGIRPAAVDVRFPVPRLYGFCLGWSAALLPVELALVGPGSSEAVPFLRLFDDHDLRWYSYFVDIDGRRDWFESTYVLCLAPQHTSNGRYRHVRLLEYAEYLLDYLRRPRLHVSGELARSQAAFGRRPNPFDLHRMAYLEYGLGQRDRARELYREGRQRYPHYGAFDLGLKELELRHP